MGLRYLKIKINRFHSRLTRNILAWQGQAQVRLRAAIPRCLIALEKYSSVIGAQIQEPMSARSG